MNDPVSPALIPMGKQKGPFMVQCATILCYNLTVHGELYLYGGVCARSHELLISIDFMGFCGLLCTADYKEIQGGLH